MAITKNSPAGVVLEGWEVNLAQVNLAQIDSIRLDRVRVFETGGM